MTAQPNPYAPPKAEVSDASDTEVVEPASRGIRFGAAMLDLLVGLVVALPVLIAIVPAWLSAGGDPTALSTSMSASIMGGAAALTTLLAVVWLVVNLLFIKRKPQNSGKKIVGIKVVRSDGSKASLARIFWLRNIVNALPGAIPFVGNFYGLVDHLFIFGSKRQCVHDKIADTIVVKA
jgi:uncharacterized RDD family membrane protein YckC